MNHDATLGGEPDPTAGSLVAALAALGPPASVPRDQVLAAFRRHLGRLQAHVRTRFEVGELGGLQAARLLASLSDGLIPCCFTTRSRCTRSRPNPARPHLVRPHLVRPPHPVRPRRGTIPSGSRWWPPAATAAASWRRSATSTCCS